MPFMVMAHDTDPRDEKLRELGDISGFEVSRNDVLVAIYMRPQKTKSGIILTDQTVDEDRYQSKVGLVVGMGPSAFDEDYKAKFGDTVYELNDWVVFRPSDGWNITVNGVLCRMLDDTRLRGRVDQPDLVW